MKKSTLSGTETAEHDRRASGHPEKVNITDGRER
jgi:hypothetical protein